MESILITDKYISPVKFSFAKIILEGTIKGFLTINNIQYIAFELSTLKSQNINFSEDQRKKDLRYNNQFKRLQKSCILPNQMYVIFQTKSLKDIDVVFHFGIEILAKLNTPSIQINISWEKFDLNQLWNYLWHIPKHNNLMMYDYNLLDLSTFSNQVVDLWILILEFKSSSMKCKEGKVIKIIEALEKINKQDITKNYFRILVNNYEEIVSYRVLNILLCD